MRRSIAIAIVLAAAILVAGCSKTPVLWPQNANRVLQPGRTYKYRVPIYGCAAPILAIDHQHWEPITPWPQAPDYPPAWHVVQLKPGTDVVSATVQRDGDHLIVAVDHGAAQRVYRMTTKPVALCA